ncbi:MAG: hypothetical protein PHR87_06060 [Sulfurospirillaceae bacterium]|nr:hypothetical protein [Sulfurospirillaceae bacterium]
MINFQEIIKNSLSNLYEAMWPLLLIIACIAVIGFYMRHEVFYSNRQRRKLENLLISFIVVPILATFVYLIVNGYFVVLFFLILLFILYILYKIGLFDNFVL